MDGDTLGKEPATMNWIRHREQVAPQTVLNVNTQQLQTPWPMVKVAGTCELEGMGSWFFTSITGTSQMDSNKFPIHCGAPSDVNEEHLFSHLRESFEFIHIHFWLGFRTHVLWLQNK